MFWFYDSNMAQKKEPSIAHEYYTYRECLGVKNYGRQLKDLSTDNKPSSPVGFTLLCKLK